MRGIFIAGVVCAFIGSACQSVGGVAWQPKPTCAGPSVVHQNGIDKVDLLFAIDNSRSMGDKQKLVAQAVPELIDRLLHPRCIDESDPNKPVDKGPSDGLGHCASGGAPEFRAVYDLHVGVVSSSMGGGGAEETGGAPICPPTATEPVFNKYNAHNDDKGHLINRTRPAMANSTGIEDTVSAAVAIDGSGGNFLAWLPQVDKNIGKTAPNVPVALTPDALTLDFQSLVLGVNEYGCGLEAQLESWYRFLIQPDPYDSLAINPDPNGGPPKAELHGVDATLLKQRHDFLRPDSLVSIVMVTDEEDSWSDPLSVGGRGWVTRATAFPGSPTNLMPRGTSACDTLVDPNNPKTTGPNDPNCTSCGFAGNMANGQPIASDPNCMQSCGPNCAGYWTAKDDNLNIRYVNDMKRRYGLDPQFPIARYVNGLSSPKVPDRNGEHPNGNGNYLGKANCTNPLFAATLPTDPMGDLCNLPLGPRTSDLIQFALIGGVPWQLLYDDAAKAWRSQLGAAEWQKILGKDPGAYDLTGIDPHMIESYLPRTSNNQASIPYLENPLPNGPSASDTADPINGREWDTTLSPLGLDLQYACTFDLPTPKECTDKANQGACDCVQNEKGPGGAPLCAPGASGNSLQVRGKAYPTIRELRVAQALGTRAAVGSVCPKDSHDVMSADYGYRPAIARIVAGLKLELSNECSPPLTTDSSGAIQCVMIERGAPNHQANGCDATNGRFQPSPSVLVALNKDRCDVLPCDADTLAQRLGALCEIHQLPQAPGGSCATSQDVGWCYVAGPAAGLCAQSIKLSTPVRNARTTLELVCNCQ